MELMSAHNQWSSRPADERFSTLSDLHSSANERRLASTSVTRDLTKARFDLDLEGNLLIHSEHGAAGFTNWAAGQMFSKLRVPRELPTLLTASVACDVLNDRLQRELASGGIDREQNMLVRRGPGAVTIRQLHSDRYERLFDSAVTQRLMEFLPEGWRNPNAYEGGEWGAKLVPSGLYAGDRSMFAFFISGGDQPGDGETREVDGEAFHRGFYVWNSEVGAKTFGFSSFEFRAVCGNNIIWGANNISTFSAAHKGHANDCLRGFVGYLQHLNDHTSVDEFANAVRAAKVEIVSRITGKPEIDLKVALASRLKSKFTNADIGKALTMGVDAAERERRPVDGSAWFWLQGLTEAAKLKGSTDDRTTMEENAGALLLAR